MSTNKTEHYGLHSWVAEDDFLRTEINENFAKLDGIMVSGSYQGNSTGPEASQTISLGFRPRMVVITDDYGKGAEGYTVYGGAFLPLPSPKGLCDLTEDGFIVYMHAQNSNNMLNHGSKTYYYLAFK